VDQTVLSEIKEASFCGGYLIVSDSCVWTWQLLCVCDLSLMYGEFCALCSLGSPCLFTTS